MTLAMAWGLTSGTLLTLIWVPPAYGILEDVTSFFAKLTSKKSAKEEVIQEEETKEESDLNIGQVV